MGLDLDLNCNLVGKLPIKQDQFHVAVYKISHQVPLCMLLKLWQQLIAGI